jgi:hypothetical protein
LLGSRIDAFDIDIGNVVIPLEAKGADSVMMERMRQMAWEGLDIVYRHLSQAVKLRSILWTHRRSIAPIHSPDPYISTGYDPCS